MKKIGAHLSISEGIESIQKQMELLECETCAIFVKNNRKFESPPLSNETIEKFKNTVKNKEIILPHGQYVINLANPEKIEKHFAAFIDELQRVHALGLKMYNFHPGSDTTKMGKQATAKFIGEKINEAMDIVPDVVICVENAAGQGNTFGRTFEELRDLISHVKDKSRIGITLDTAHLFAGGYDIRTKELFHEVIVKFDEIVGLKYLKAMHLNDSQTEFSSYKDRHACLGQGKIGLEAFKFVMESKMFDDIPLILETPRPELFKQEIAMLKSFESN